MLEPVGQALGERGGLVGAPCTHGLMDRDELGLDDAPQPLASSANEWIQPRDGQFEPFHGCDERSTPHALALQIDDRSHATHHSEGV